MDYGFHISRLYLIVPSRAPSQQKSHKTAIFTLASCWQGSMNALTHAHQLNMWHMLRAMHHSIQTKPDLWNAMCTSFIQKRILNTSLLRNMLKSENSWSEMLFRLESFLCPSQHWKCFWGHQVAVLFFASRHYCLFKTRHDAIRSQRQAIFLSIPDTTQLQDATKSITNHSQSEKHVGGLSLQAQCCFTLAAK